MYPAAPSQFAPSRFSRLSRHGLGALLAVGLLTPVAPAATLSLSGTFDFSLGSTRVATPLGIVLMGGRRDQLKAAYVRTGTLKGGTITNTSSSASNYLSVELHRKAFIGATTSNILYCRAYNALAAGRSHSSISSTGYFKSPNLDGFGVFNVYELGINTSTNTYFWTKRATKDLKFARF